MTDCGCPEVPESVAHSPPFTSDGQGLQRVSAGAPPVLGWCSSVVGVESGAAHSSPFTSDGQGPQRVSAGAPPVLQWCSSVVGAESGAHDNLCQIVPFCATQLPATRTRLMPSALDDRRSARGSHFWGAKMPQVRSYTDFESDSIASELAGPLHYLSSGDPKIVMAFA